jgi:holo-[acyl-carrier protein] synthase
MIYGIGTDIVRVERIRHGLERYGDKFARRILTDLEYTEYTASINPAHFVAKRFAAKEAAAKAMGLGFTQGLSLRHIGISHDEKGKPVLNYYDRAKELAGELGIGESHVSIADEEDHAVAFVTLMAD